MDRIKLANRYEIVRPLGEGSMGTVYLARDPLLERDVAIKLVKRNLLTPETQERFRREALVVAKFDHPSLVAVYDTGDHEGSLFFVMPFVEGESLRALMDRRGLQLDEYLNIAIQVADALEYSHIRGVIHRDIKPENILITRDAQGPRARVTDFGLALTSYDQRITATGVVVGTVAYLSPEIVTGKDADPRSDIYSLAVVLYEAVAGRTPFIGDLRSILFGITYESPRPATAWGAQIPAELDALLMKCLQRDPELRPQRAQDLADDLSTIRFALQGSVSAARSSGPLLLQPVGRSRNFAFVGRSREYSELQRRLDSAIAGESQLVLVSGEPGSGKSAMIEQLTRIAHARRIPVYQGRYSEQDFPYQGFSELFQEFFRRLNSDPKNPGTDEAFADLAPELISVFPALAQSQYFQNARSDLIETEQGIDTASLYDLLARVLVRMSAGEPMVIILEDLHYAGDSVAALHPILMRLGRVPVLIAGTFRNTETGRNHPMTRLIRNLFNQRNFSLIELKAFPFSDFRKLVESITMNVAPSESFLEKLYEATEGNPYFTREVIRSLTESGAIKTDELGRLEVCCDLEMTFDSLPATVQQTVEKRLQNLPDHLKEVLSAASVLGKIFESSDLEFLLEGSEQAEDAIDLLIQEGFLDEEKESYRSDRLRFSSAMVRDASYSFLSRRKRKGYHGKFAAELERRNAGFLERVYPQIIFHYARAGVAEKVIEYGVSFAKNLLRTFSTEEAIRTLRTVLEYDPGLREGEVRRLLGRAYRLAGDAEEALEEFKKAAGFFEKQSGSLAAEVMAEAAETAWHFRLPDDARLWIERGIPIARASEANVALKRLLSLGATAANLRGDYETARVYGQEADRLEKSGPVVPAAIRSGILHVPVSGVVYGLDPSRVFTLEEEETVPLIFETLTRQSKAAGVQPWLAAEFHSENGARSFRFRLRDDVHFHNGRKMTARDVQYSLQRLQSGMHSRKRWLLTGVTGIEVLSDLELRIHLENPIAFFPALLADTSCAVVPHGTERVIGNWTEQCAGTGPFRVSRFEPSQMLELEPHPNYWRPNYPKSERLIFTFGVAPEDIASGFRSGLFSLAWDLHPEDVEELLRDSQLAPQYKETPSLSTYYLAFNTNHGVLKEEHLRHSVVASIKREPLVRAYTGRIGVPAHGLIPPGLLGYESEPSTPPFMEIDSSSKSTEAIKIADQEITLHADIHPIYAGPYFEFAEALFDDLKQKGFICRPIDTKKRSHEPPPPDADFELGRWVADYPDPDAVMYLLLQSEKGLLGRFCGSREMDILMEKGRSETNSVARHQIYREIENVIEEKALLLPLFHEQAYRFALKEVQGFQVSFGRPVVHYEKLWIKR